MSENGPLYGVPLIDTLPLTDDKDGMRQAMPNASDLKRVARVCPRVAGGYEVLLAHYQNMGTKLAGVVPAAAPDLLAACESMADAWEHYLRNPDNIGVDIEAEIDNARAAIAKAQP